MPTVIHRDDGFLEIAVYRMNKIIAWPFTDAAAVAGG